MSDEKPHPPAGSAWNSPQVIAAAIGGIVTIVVAVVGIIPTLIQQNTAPTPVLATFTPTFTVSPTDTALILPTDTPSATSPLTVSDTPIPTPTEIRLPTIPPTEVPSPEPVLIATPVPNLRLLYDDVSFTVHNFNAGTFSLAGVVFQSASGVWDAAMWGTTLYNSLPANNCLRLRNVESGQRQPPRVCGNLYGLQLVGTSALFWIHTPTFDVLKNGDVIATCDTAAGECLIYVP